MGDFTKKEITKKSENISDWYTDVILKAQIADYAPVKGTMVIRPYGYAIWEQVTAVLDSMFKSKGIQNAYFPLFIPHSLLEKEKEHVAGFSPELAVVTIAGGEELKDPLVIRPTSETIMYEMYAKWIQSWRDLPILINQWNNVVRWEKRTYPFLRTSEFLWQEGHTAHETEKEAIEMDLMVLEWYRRIYEDYYAIPVMLGTKSDAEKFAGAKTTYTVEALMPDGKALQGATSHNLGQNFSKPFKIQFQNREGKNDFVWQTSWGFSTRSLGGLFLTHGDDQGLILPPKIAPIKAVVIPILGKDDARILDICQKVKEKIEKKESLFAGRVELWDDPAKTFGWKVNEAELKGIPAIIIVGLREVEEQCVSLTSRHNNQKHTCVIAKIDDELERVLVILQDEMFKTATQFLKENTHEVSSYDKFKKILDTTRGFIWAFWCEDATCEKAIKEETKATTRLLPLDAKDEVGTCIKCRNRAKHRWLFAQSY